MDKMTILSQSIINAGGIGFWEYFILGFFILYGVILLGFGLYFIIDYDADGFIVLLVSLFLLFVGFYVLYVNYNIEEYVEYKVIIEKDIDINKFYEDFEVLDIEGSILTIKKKDL